jgi:hypothetical protein
MDPSTAFKNQIMNNYLTQQMLESEETSGSSGGEIQAVDVPTPEELEDFRTYVKAWVEIDNAIRKLQAVVRERNQAKQQVSNRILAFMMKFNVEDLNTKECKLRYSVRQVKAPLSQSMIKTKLIELYDPTLSADELSSKIFDNRGTTEKHTLRRIAKKGASTPTSAST